MRPGFEIRSYLKIESPTELEQACSFNDHKLINSSTIFVLFTFVIALAHPGVETK